MVDGVEIIHSKESMNKAIKFFLNPESYKDVDDVYIDYNSLSQDCHDLMYDLFEQSPGIDISAYFPNLDKSVCYSDKEDEFDEIMAKNNYYSRDYKKMLAFMFAHRDLYHYYPIYISEEGIKFVIVNMLNSSNKLSYIIEISSDSNEFETFETNNGFLKVDKNCFYDKNFDPMNFDDYILPGSHGTILESYKKEIEKMHDWFMEHQRPGDAFDAIMNHVVSSLDIDIAVMF